MLVNLHVKNLALIEEENIDFDEGLNILSGETGAGKSIMNELKNLVLYHVMTVNLLFQGKSCQIVHRLRLMDSLLHPPRPEFLHMN